MAPNTNQSFTNCFVDESIHATLGFVVTALVFADAEFENKVCEALRLAGLRIPDEEYKSSARMDADFRMRAARDLLMSVVTTSAQIAVFVGPFYRPRLGRQTLQALQSILVRNAIERSGLNAYFDREIFPSQKEATRLHQLFHALQGVAIHAQQDSKLRFGVQAADAVAYSFGQIIKEAVAGAPKMVDVGGEGTGYPPGTVVPLGWELLMQLRHVLLTRPVVYDGSDYPSESDPTVLDPQNDDPVSIAQHPVLLGWGVQVAPESEAELRMAVEQALGKVWLGCIH